MSDLCTACMCSGRNLYFIGETGCYPLYAQILNEIQVYDTSLIYIRVCWECRAMLRKWSLFKERAKKSYSLLQYIQQNNFLVHPPDPPHLQIHHIHNFSYPLQIKIEAGDTTSPLGDEDEIDRLDGVKVDSIKTEETHCEPETFVKNLNLEPKKKKKESKKVEKPIKEKSKKKSKGKTEKLPVKKKIKVKKKRPSTPESFKDDNVFDDDGITDDDFDVKKDEITDVVDNKTSVIIAKIVLEEGKETTRLNGELKPKEVPIKEVLPEKPHCVECGKNFSSRKTYRYHLNVLHKGNNRYPCPRCGKVYQWKSNLGRHLRSHKARDSGELYCETCDKRFASVATYRQHLRVSRRHVPESEFSFMCNECGKKFVSKTRLRDHIDWEHLKKIKFKCQLCNKPFKCHTSLYVHMQNVHRNKEKKDNLCHVCGKSYQNAAKLKYHIVAMHTSETPYQCQQCTAAFGWYSSLYRHVREVHYKMKVQPKKSKKSKKLDILPSILPQVILTQLHQPGPT